LHETWELDGCKTVLEVAYKACNAAGMDGTLLHAHLLNTEGVHTIQLLEYERGEKAMNQALEIRKRLLPETDDRVAGIVNNLGNLYAARGENQKALEFYQKSDALHVSKDYVNTEVDVCRSALNTARLCVALQDHDAAWKQLNVAGPLLKGLADPTWEAAYDTIAGNLLLSSGDYETARTRFNSALVVRQARQPGKPVVCSLFYKLACLEMKLNNLPSAQ
jgi:predicted negative regulator of RcsB-dependent stress response